uniref:Uncharacterized protein n=1 Tax=Arundo donax TaxID=35708 RepID=A0A0A9FIT6_ARUDO
MLVSMEACRLFTRIERGNSGEASTAVRLPCRCEIYQLMGANCVVL